MRAVRAPPGSASHGPARPGTDADAGATCQCSTSYAYGHCHTSKDHCDRPWRAFGRGGTPASRRPPGAWARSGWRSPRLAHRPAPTDQTAAGRSATPHLRALSKGRTIDRPSANTCGACSRRPASELRAAQSTLAGLASIATRNLYLKPGRSLCASAALG